MNDCLIRVRDASLKNLEASTAIIQGYSLGIVPSVDVGRVGLALIGGAANGANVLRGVLRDSEALTKLDSRK